VSHNWRHFPATSPLTKQAYDEHFIADPNSRCFKIVVAKESAYGEGGESASQSPREDSGVDSFGWMPPPFDVRFILFIVEANRKWSLELFRNVIGSNEVIDTPGTRL
jgi:hypothetical protein